MALGGFEIAIRRALARPKTIEQKTSRAKSKRDLVYRSVCSGLSLSLRIHPTRFRLLIRCTAIALIHTTEAAFMPETLFSLTLKKPYSVYGHLPFCKHFVTSGLGYDCTRIFGLLIERNCSGHNGLFARLFLIGLSCSRHNGIARFCKRRFDLFSISYLCYTIVGRRFLSQTCLS